MGSINQRSARGELRKLLSVAKLEARPFAVYGITYALLSLLVPVIIQLLVNSLAMNGLMLNIFTLSVIMTAGLALLQFCRLSQIFLLEYLERKIMALYTPRFAQLPVSTRSYYFELASLPKTLSKWALDGFEIFLALAVGSLILMVYHPFFVVIALVVWFSLWGVYRLGQKGLQTALDESAQKYAIWDQLSLGHTPRAQEWLIAREHHFQILRRQLMLLLLIQVLGPVALLAGGSWLFSIGQLSLGQFVAAELIGSGIFVAIGKLGKFLDSHYALLTALVKVEYALEKGNE